MRQTLESIDSVLGAAALVGLAVAAVCWAVWSRRDPLINAPFRRNDLREDGLAVAVLVYLLAALAATGGAGLLGLDENKAVVRLVAAGAAQTVGIVACLWVAALAFDGGVTRFLAGKGGATLAGIAAALCVMLLGVGLCPVLLRATVGLIEMVSPSYELVPHPTISALREAVHPTGAKVLLWAGAVVIAPTAEEIFFRGLLQTFLVKVFRSRWVAIGASAAAFGLVHVSQVYAIPALIFFAVLLGYVYERTGSLIPPILVHACFNLKTLLWETLGAYP